MPQESTYLFSGSYTEFNKFYAPAVLQEYMMLETIKRGIPRYNFLGIQGIFDGSDGVLRFKQNFNGYIVRKMGTFRYYPSPLEIQTDFSHQRNYLRRSKGGGKNSVKLKRVPQPFQLPSSLTSKTSSCYKHQRLEVFFLL